MSYHDHIDEAIKHITDTGCTQVGAATFIIDKYKIDKSHNAVRKAIGEKMLAAKHRGLKDECEKVQAPPENVAHYWVKTPNYSMFVKNDAPEQDHFLDAIKEILAEYKPTYKPVILRPAEGSNGKAMKTTIADAHVGMEPNPNDYSIFKYEYNAEIFNQNIDHVIQSMVK